jgi:hypothetical protein
VIAGAELPRPGSSGRRTTLELAGAGALCLLFALRALPGFFSHASHALTPDHQDPLLNLVLLEWGAHQWRLGLPDFWNANFFFPTAGVMALSDHLLGPSLALMLLGRLGAGPILAYNLILLVALAASPFALYLLLRRCELSWEASVVAALGWGFAACRMSQIGHVQLLLALWIPPLVWSFDRLIERPGAARATIFIVFYALHLAGGSYLAYMAHVTLLGVAAARWRTLVAARRRPRLALWLTAAATASGVFAAWIYLPYQRYGAASGSTRSALEWARFGADWRSWLTPAPGTALARWSWPAAEPEGALFPGAVTLLLVAVALAAGLASRRSSSAPRLRSPLERGLILGALACCALSFAPVFSIATHLLPGLDGLRVPARFAQLAGLGLAPLAADGCERLMRGSASAARVAILGALVVALGIELLPARARWEPLAPASEFPAVDRWLASSPEVTAYVDLPFPPRNRLTREAAAMYHSTLGWKGLVNGRSGYFPPSWRRAYAAIPVMPDAAALDLLRSYGVTHVLVREESMLEQRWRRGRYLDWKRRFDAGEVPGLEQVYESPSGDRVYRIAPDGAATTTPASR